MSQGSEVGWTHDTFSPWHGCSRKSAGCLNCYADEDTRRWKGPGHALWRKNGPRQIVADSTWRQPLTWNRAAAASGYDRLVFCASMCDVFEPHPQVGEARQRLWTLIARTPHLTWQLLTKRPEHVTEMVPWPQDRWPRNVWLGVTVEAQREADERIPLLMATGAHTKFLSCEPLLEEVDLTAYLVKHRPAHDAAPVGAAGCGRDGMALRGREWTRTAFLDWLIVGGEKAALAKARPMELDWALSLVEQAEHAGVPVFVKQLGSVLARDLRVRGAGRNLTDLPWELRVRQFPHGVRLAPAGSDGHADDTRSAARVAVPA